MIIIYHNGRQQVMLPLIVYFKSSDQCVGFDWDTNNNVPSRCWHHFDISNLANVDVGSAPGISHYRKLSCAGQRSKYTYIVNFLSSHGLFYAEWNLRY